MIQQTDGLPIHRIENIFGRIIIDEAQDISGWDLELIEYLFSSSIDIFLVGDHRQATFSTNDNPKNKQYAGERILNKFLEWGESGLCDIEHQNISHRCVQHICDFSDRLFPESPKTISQNQTVTGHDGVFLLKESDVARYLEEYDPQPLQWSKAGAAKLGNPMNFGDSKGMTFERVLVYPHANLRKFLKTGKLELEGQSKTKSYVALTRARQSVVIVVPDKFKSPILGFFEFPN